MDRGAYRVLLRMIQFDHLMGKWKDCRSDESLKWGKMESFGVVYDASTIVDIVQKLTVD